MTTTQKSSRRASRLPLLRAATWYLHVLVSFLAVFSLFSTRFDLWIDLRMLGNPTSPNPSSNIIPTLIKLLWVATVLLIPLSSGPRLAGFLRPHWNHRGWSPEWAASLLWPTYFLLACLIANTVYFYVLVLHKDADLNYALPAPLLVAILLSAWTLLTRQWIRTSKKLPASAPAKHTTQLYALLATLPAAALGIAFFLLHAPAHPPTQPIDLAVVLGSGVRPDGSPSTELADRTRAAIDLYKQGLVHHLFLSGAVWPASHPGGPLRNETTAMLEVCRNPDNNIPLQDITLDPVGLNTRATAYNTSQFMQSHNYKSVVICTSDYHLLRTAKTFRDYGLDPFTCSAAPSNYRCADPAANLRELAAILVYNIDPHYREPKALTMKLTSPRLVAHKSRNLLELFDGQTLVKSYTCITGGNPGDKQIEGDRKTPLGQFHIVYKNPQSKFHLSLGLDYPTKEYADRGLKAGLINQQQYDDILAALQSDLSLDENQKKLWKSPLGGEIFIHGHAQGRDNTAGCIALTNTDIEELYAILPLNTPVEIQP